MDTKTVATALGTDARVLRRFLRDPKSTFSAVGSGSRYTFTESDIPELERRFADWQGNKQPARPTVVKVVDTADTQRIKDEVVWEEEGPVVLEDLRDRKVLAKVRAKAKAWDDRLNERLMAAGLHISQMRDRAVAA